MCDESSILPGKQLYPALVIFIEILLKSWYVNMFHDSLFTYKQEMTPWVPQETSGLCNHQRNDANRMIKGDFRVCLKPEAS